MDGEKAYAALNEIFRDVFMRDDIELKPEYTTADVSGWDSFKQIEIIMALSEKYGFKFTSKELDNLRNVGDLAQLVQAKAA
jgi:acyl carrier protein